MRKYIAEKCKDKIAKGSLKLFMVTALTMGYIMIQIGDARSKNKRY